MRRHIVLALGAAVFCSSLFAQAAPAGPPQGARGQQPPGAAAQGPPAMHIYIRSGLKTHGPGQHDYPQFLADWSQVLTERGAAVDGSLHFPTAAELKDTDVLVMYKGDSGYLSPEEKDTLEAYLKRGGGLVSLHDTLCGPDPAYFSTIVGGAKKHGETNYTLEADVPYTIVDASNPERDRHIAAVQTVLAEVGPQFERATGHKLTVSSDLPAEFVRRANAGEPITVFEITTAAGMLLFSRHPADVLVMEVGLGGRLDATNVIEHPLVTGIANLALDHQQFLGNRLPDIAAEKAAIAKAGTPLITQLYPPAVGTRVEEVARKLGVSWLPRGGKWDAIASGGKLRYRDAQGALVLPLPKLLGRHQAMNAALAVAMLASLTKAATAKRRRPNSSDASISCFRSSSDSAGYSPIKSPGTIPVTP